MEEKKEPYRVLLSDGVGEIVEKKSRFIATVRIVHSEEEATAFIDEMKKKYWNATHNCSAFVVGEKAELTRCSDDGEPSGTAGRPMLEVLLGEGIRNVAVVVTRYFGGILLGTGGLVRAYSEAAKTACDNAEIIEMGLIGLYRVQCDYQQYNRFVPLAKNMGATVMDTVFGEQVTINISMPDELVDVFEKTLTDTFAGRLYLEENGKIFAKIKKIQNKKGFW